MFGRGCRLLASGQEVKGELADLIKEVAELREALVDQLAGIFSAMEGGFPALAGALALVLTFSRGCGWREAGIGRGPIPSTPKTARRVGTCWVASALGQHPDPPACCKWNYSAGASAMPGREVSARPAAVQEPAADILLCPGRPK